MSRKSNLDALFGAKPSLQPAPTPAPPPVDPAAEALSPEPEAFAAANPAPAEPEFASANPGNPGPRPPERSRSGAVRAMSSTLRGLAARADHSIVLPGGAIVRGAEEVRETAADETAGSRAGTVTSSRTRRGDAPSVRAASSRRRSSRAH